MKDLTKKTMSGMRIMPYNAQHIGKREEQQDSFSYSDMFDMEERSRRGAVAVLADGMGGMKNGGLASLVATNTFLQTYLSMPLEDAVSYNMTAAVQAANEAVKKIDGAGSTLVASIIKARRLYWISVGDSRIYIYRHKNLIKLNTEHNYANVLIKKVREGKISVQEALNDPDRAALTSYLGLERLKATDIDSGNTLLRRGDSILLCSDGLYNTLSEEEMCYIIASADHDVCDVMVDVAMSKGIANQDNITVMLMDLD